MGPTGLGGVGLGAKIIRLLNGVEFSNGYRPAGRVQA